MNDIDYANDHDRAVAGRYEAREADWRNGAVSYQVYVDRFAPSADLAAKAHLYPAPKRLRHWDDLPQRGAYVPEAKLYAHEIEFWGGDLASLQSNLDYITSLSVDVVYLNPIHLAYTNHKYDALDYATISPEFGTRDDFIALAADVHERGMKLVLDGVFNHMGRNSEAFKSAEASPDSLYRDWFTFGDEYPGGARSWWLAENLPELNLENDALREYLFTGADSIVRGFLRDGADGWRLDVAVDLGFRYLDELTRAAHDEKPGSLVIGEIATYPAEWFPHVDAVLNFVLRTIIIGLVTGRIGAAHAGRMLERLYGDADYEHMLKSWLYLDNHDTARIASTVPDVAARRIAQLLMFTLPGAPNLYYGSELGMTGVDDPEMRAPMRWDLVNDENPDFTWVRQLINVHQTNRALRVGDFRMLVTDKLLGFERYTDRIADSVVVIVNPAPEPVTETVLLTNSKFMDPYPLLNVLTYEPAEIPVRTSMLHVELPAFGFAVLKAEIHPAGGYSTYKRVQ